MIQHILGVCIIYTLHVYSYDTLVSFALVLFWGLEASLPFASAAGRVTWSNYHGGSATPQKGNHPNPKGLTRLWTTNKHLWYLEVSINGGTYGYPKIDVFSEKHSNEWYGVPPFEEPPFVQLLDYYWRVHPLGCINSRETASRQPIEPQVFWNL